MWVRWACTVRGDMKAARRFPCCKAFGDEFHDVELGAGQRTPAASRAFAFAAAAQRIGDGFLDRQRRTLGPCGIEIVLTQGISKCGERGLVALVENLEAHKAHVLTGRARGAEEARGQ